MSKKVIMFDVDGVLADFVHGYTKLANKLFGTRIVTTLEQPSWNFRTWGLLTKGQETAVWDRLKKDSTWWETLPALATRSEFDRICKLHWFHDVVFCTNRVTGPDSLPVSEQTKRWLRRCGVPDASVIVSGRKGEVARAIGATHSIDDKIENAWAVHWISDSPQTKSVIINRPYNQIQALPEVGPSKVLRVNTVGEFVDLVERD